MTTIGRLLTNKDVADYLGVSTMTLHRMTKAGEGPPRHRVSGSWRYEAEEVREWLRSA